MPISNSILRYFAKAFRTEAFRRTPVKFLLRTIKWLLIIFFENDHELYVDYYNYKIKLPAVLRHAGSTGIFLQREYYDPVYPFLRSVVKEGAVFVDCGANLGVYTLAAARLVGPEGRVLGIEPQQYCVEYMAKSLHLNAFENVAIYNCAVWNRTCTMWLNIADNKVSAYLSQDRKAVNATKVKVRTLDDILGESRIDRVDVLKLDVEGAEAKALLGASQALDRFRPSIIFEVIDPDSENSKSVQSMLAARNYHFYIVDARQKRFIEIDKFFSCPTILASASDPPEIDG